MGAMQRSKGARGERELALLLRSAGIDAKRVSPLEAGGAGFGDVADGQGHTWQVKLRKRVHLYEWLEGCDRLAVRGDRQEWLVVMPLREYLEIVGDVGGDGDGAA